MDSHPEVFISYARKDGDPLARWIRERLGREHIRLWQDLADLEGGRGWWTQIAAALDVVEVMVLVLTPGAVASPIVRQEWQYARQRGVRIYPVRGSMAPQPDFAAMPRWMSKAHCYDLDTEWDKFVFHLKGPGRAARVPFMAPDLPAGFVQRPREFDQLRALLLDGDRGDPVAITTSLVGAGGFGKTTLAAALCHDDDVLTAFDDGILWITLGEYPNVLDGLARLSAALDEEDPGFRDVEQGAQGLAARLKRKSCLIVVDDVWEPAHLQPFLRGGIHCARLITTRQLPIAVGARGQRVTVDEMTADESVRMLTAKLEEPPADLQPFRALARRLGEWPLMLELIGAALQLWVARGKTVAGALDRVHRDLDKKGVTAFDQARSAVRHGSIVRSIGVSLDLLEPQEQRRYLELAIFAEDVEISLGALTALWGLDALDTEEQAGRMSDLSMLKCDLRAGTVRLHDVVRKYLAERLEAPAAVHARLVDAWGDPLLLPDAFAWRWLTYHLLGAGRRERLREQLLVFTWLRAKLKATDVHALLADFDHLPDDSDLRLVQGAIRLSAHVLAQDQGQLRGQLYGRLLPCDTPAIEQLRTQVASANAGPWLRPLTPCLAPPGGSLLRTLGGNSGAVNAVAVTPDGRYAISAASDKTLKFWDLQSGQALRTLEGHASGVSAVAVLLDGRRALSASDDKALKLWDLQTGQVLRTLEGHAGGVSAVAVLPDDRHALSSSFDKTLKLWDLQTGQVLCTLEGHAGGVLAVAVLPDGRHALSASSDKTLKLWDLQTGQALHTLEGHTDWVRAVAVLPDGRRALSASDDETLKLWDLQTGLATRTLERHAGGVNAVAVLPDGRYALSAADDHTLKLWDLQTGRALRTLEGHTGGVSAVAVLPDGCHAISTSDDKTLKLWDLQTGQALRTPERHAGGVSAVAVLPDGLRAISASDDKTLKLWDLQTGQATRTLEGHAGGVTAVAVLPDDRHVLSASDDETLKLWNLLIGHEPGTLQGYGGPVTAAAVLPDGRHALSASSDKTLKLWNLRTGHLLRTLQGYDGWVRAVAVLPDGRHALSASDDKTLKLWDLQSGQATRTLEGHAGGVNAVAVLPDGRHALSASDDHTLKLWDLQSGQALRTLEGHAGEVRAVAVLPDGRHALSASSDKTLRLWDLDSGALLASFHGEAAFWSCAVTPDGVTFLGGDAGGRVHFLRLEGM